MDRKTLLKIGIATVVFTGVAFLASLGLTIFGFIKLHRGVNGPTGITWVKASLTLTTVWLALFVTGLIVPDTSSTVGNFDENNPSFHVGALSSIFGVSAFLAVMFTQVEIVRDFKTPTTQWISRKLAFTVLGSVLFLNCLRLIFAEVYLLAKFERLGVACNVIDIITISTLLLFNLAAFVFLARARDTVDSHAFKYFMAIYIITSCRFSYQTVYTILFFLSLYSVDLGLYWSIFMQIPTVLVSAWSLLACVGLLCRVAFLRYNHMDDRYTQETAKGVTEEEP